MNHIDEGLKKLIARGFQFLHPRDADGAVVTIVGLRAHNDVVDLVHLYSERDAQACRVPVDEPDVFAPNSVYWRHSGTADEVIAAVLELADPLSEMEAAAAEAAKGCWVPVGPGHAKWLAMPA
jgi:hypothetical protein